MHSIIYLLILFFNLSILAMENELPTIDQLIKALEKNDPILTQQIVSVNPDLINQQFSMQLVDSLESKNYLVTPLHITEKKCAKVLIKNGADVNARCSYGETPLDRALLHDDNIPLALFLMRSGATVNNVDNRGNSLLHNIIDNNDVPRKLVPFLLEHGADIEVRNNRKQTPLDVAIEKRSLCVPYFKNIGIMFIYKNSDTLHDPYKLLQNNATLFRLYSNTNFLNQRDEQTKMECRLAKLFMFIQKWERKQSIAGSPSTYGIIINRHGYCFTKPTFEDLYELVGENSVEYVKKHFDYRCKRAYKTLKTDPECFLQIMKTYPYVLTYNRSLQRKMFDYMIRTMKDSTHTVFIETVIKHLKDINFTYTNNQTLLHRAVVYNNPLFLELLMMRYIDFTHKCYRGTALCCAKEDKRTQCIESFYKALGQRLSLGFNDYILQEKIKEFISKYCDLERRNEKGETLLLMLCNNPIPRERWLKFILKLGARVNVKSNAGESPLNIVTYYHSMTAIQLLVKHSAIVTQAMIQKSRLIEQEKVLQATYDEQHCIVCYEHPETLGEIPCKNRHIGSFLCQECYNAINRDCPYRCGKLDDFNAV